MASSSVFSSLDVSALRHATKRLTADANLARWRSDPAAWATEVLGVHLWSKQREIAKAITEHRHVAVQSAAGIGKSFLASVLALWFGSVYPTYDSKIVTTAPTADQVTLILWSEIRKHHANAGLPGAINLNNRWMAPDGRYVLGFGRKPPDHATAAFQGAHATHMLIIVDEAGGIGEKMWADIRAISTGADVTVLAIGNPDDSSSTFHDMCTRIDAGWHVFKISAFDTPNFTGEVVPAELTAALPSRAYVDDAKRGWGEHNPYYIAKVLGDWADAEDGLIPLSWITQATARWRDFMESYDPVNAQPGGRPIYGVDVARFGADKTAIAHRQGHVCFSVNLHAGLDNVQVADLVDARLTEHAQSMAVVDADGLGSGVVDVLRHRGRNVYAYSGGAGTKRTDSTGTQRFQKVRSAAWWHMRELLNPALGASICLPPIPELAAELAAPKWPEDPGNFIQIERKDDIRKRLGRSTDTADAVIQAFWIESMPEHEDLSEQLHTPRALDYAASQRWDAPPGWNPGGGFNWDSRGGFDWNPSGNSKWFG